jgi:outer membrane protein TolC
MKRAYPPRPDVSPAGQVVDENPLRLDASQTRPMYTELHAVDLPTVIRLAQAQNFDIQQARQAVEAAQGNYESAVGDAFPAIVPTAFFQRRDGRFLNTDGRIFDVGSANFSASVAIDWVINPGQIIYNILAAKKRLYATEFQEEHVKMETLRLAAVQYYSLALAQARIETARQGVKEAEELLRIERVRLRTGTGVQADELRAKAQLAARQQDLVSALHGFYRTSVDLTVTLHLDPSVTLVPRIETLPRETLVRDDLEIEEMLAIAVTFRPDLQSVRETMEAALADRKRTWWSGFGPDFTLGYEYGGITGNANNVVPNEGIPSNLVVNPTSATGSFSSNPVANGVIREGIVRGSRRLAGSDDQTFRFSQFTRGTAGVGWRFSISAFGDLKKAAAAEASAIIDAARKIDEVRASVVNIHQEVIAHRRLGELALQQVESAEEALRLSQANLQAGIMTTLDVLQAQDALTQARLRHILAVVGYNQAQVNLLAALGLVDPETLLGLPVAAAG